MRWKMGGLLYDPRFAAGDPSRIAAEIEQAFFPVSVAAAGI
jgi:hypothetical protein